MSLVIDHAGLSDRGLVREENEDSWSAALDQGLFIVSDGMGGHLGGAVASKIVVEALPKLLRRGMAGIEDLAASNARTCLEGALTELSVRLREQTRGEPGLEGMGATVVLAMLRGSTALIAHMGDSRAYLLRSGQLRQLTKDHSIVQLLVDAGEITPQEALAHPARGQVTRCVGMEGEILPEVDHLELEGGDRLLLCTDGLTGMLDDQEIEGILCSGGSPKDACRKLVDATNEAGGKDNVTALVVNVENIVSGEDRNADT